MYGWQPGQPLQSLTTPGSLMPLMVSWTAELVSRRGNLHEFSGFETESPSRNIKKIRKSVGEIWWRAIHLDPNVIWQLIGPLSRKPTRFFQGPFGPWDISKHMTWKRCEKRWRQGKIIENWFTCATTLTEAPAGAKAAKKQKEHGSRKHKN